MDKKFFVENPEQLCEINSLKKADTGQGPNLLSLVRVWTVAERQNKAEVFRDHLYVRLIIKDGERLAHLVRISPTGNEEKVLMNLKFPQTLKYCKQKLLEEG